MRPLGCDHKRKALIGPVKTTSSTGGFYYFVGGKGPRFSETAGEQADESQRKRHDRKNDIIALEGAEHGIIRTENLHGNAAARSRLKFPGVDIAPAGKNR